MAASDRYTRHRDTGSPNRMSIVPRSTSPTGTRVQTTIACVQMIASTTGWTHAMAMMASGPSTSPMSVPSSALMIDRKNSNCRSMPENSFHNVGRIAARIVSIAISAAQRMAVAAAVSRIDLISSPRFTVRPPPARSTA
jgi:hypothetical protein